MLSKLFKYVESEKMLTWSVISWGLSFLCNKEMSKNPENWWKFMKIVNIDREILHNFWTLEEFQRNFQEDFRKTSGTNLSAVIGT